jgi:MFS family permease
MALLYTTSASTVAWLPRSPARDGARDQHVWADLMEGLRYVWADRRVRLELFFFVTVTLVGFPHVTVLPGLLENELGRPTAEVSALYLSSAVGALGASLLVARVADSGGALVAYAGLAFGFGAGIFGLAAAPSTTIAGVWMFVIGACSGGFQALNAAVIARHVAPAYIGRVMSLTLLAFAGFGLMALPFGILADAVGERATLGVMAVGVTLLSIFFTTGLARVQREDGARPG